jgi:hypothetical protein
MKLDIFFIAITLISSFSHVFSLPILKYVRRDIAPIDERDLHATRAANIHPREALQDVDGLVLRQAGAIDGPELERRLNIGALARVARVVAPKVLKIAKPFVSKVGRFAANGLKRLKGGAGNGARRHAPRTGTRAGGRAKNVRSVGRKIGRSVRTVDRAANHVNNVANTVNNVRSTVDSFRRPR